ARDHRGARDEDEEEDERETAERSPEARPVQEEHGSDRGAPDRGLGDAAGVAERAGEPVRRVEQREADQQEREAHETAREDATTRAPEARAADERRDARARADEP